VRRGAVVAVLLLTSAAARAQTRLSLAPELALAAGYDDNLFLDPALSGNSSAAPRADAIVDIRPSLTARLVHAGHALVVDADYFERVTPSNGDLRDLWLRLAWSTPTWKRLRLTLASLYEHYEAARFRDNTFDAGGGEALLRLVLAQAWLEVGYRGDARGYSDPARNAQLDVEHWAVATAHVRLHRLLGIDAGYRFLHLSSNAPTAGLERHRADLLVALRPTAWLSASAGYAIWGQALPHGAAPLNANTPGGPRSDIGHGVSVAASARPRPWLEIFARYELLISTSDANTGRYRRDQVTGGVAVSWTFSRQSLPPTPPLLPTVRGREVTFRARARPGAAVAVIGDWSGWQPLPLAPAGGDRFESTFALAAGRHAFALSIDGVVSTPVAAAFVEDGFGGKNGVVDVP
jgi:hypothetical protein